MDRLSQQRDREPAREPEPPAPEPVQAGSLAWASAVGNQAVQRLARQASPEVAESEAGEVEAEAEPPPEVAALESAGIGAGELAGLDALDDMTEDQLPE